MPHVERKIMVVTRTILLIVIISFIIPRDYLQRYYILAAVILSSLYLFTNPTESDLTRLYGLVDAIKDVSVKDILFLNERNYGNYFLNLYMGHYMIFNLYAKLMSYLPRTLFVFFPALMMYLLPVKLVFDEGQNISNNRWIYVFSYDAFLMCTDFLSISAIRNIGVAMLFCFILYYDLSDKWKKVYCFIGYLLLFLIHSYAALLLMIRLVVMISNKYTKYIFAAILAVGYGFFVSGNSLVTRLLNGTGVLSYALGRLNHYTDYTGTTVASRRAYMLIIYILLLFITFIAYRSISSTLEKERKKFANKLFDYFLFSTIFSIGAFSQYDTFIRGSFIIFPVWILLMEIYMEKISGRRFGLIVSERGHSMLANAIVYIGSISAVVLIFFYLSRTGYDWMDSWFVK